MDNSRMFTEAYQILKNNGSVCIFPEGTSHDRTNFIKLKAGVALMALGAMAHHDTQEIKIMSAGLSYFRREEFRSQVLLEFGTPFTIPKEWGELFKTDKKAVCRLSKAYSTIFKKSIYYRFFKTFCLFWQSCFPYNGNSKRDCLSFMCD